MRRDLRKTVLDNWHCRSILQQWPKFDQYNQTNLPTGRTVRLAMGKGLELSVSQPWMVGLDLGKKGRRYTSMIRITRGSSGGPLNTASPRQGKVPGKTSGRYLLLEFDPKDHQVEPTDRHSLPLLPHVWKNQTLTKVLKIPPDFRLWQGRVLESSSSQLLGLQTANNTLLSSPSPSPS